MKQFTDSDEVPDSVKIGIKSFDREFDGFPLGQTVAVMGDPSSVASDFVNQIFPRTDNSGYYVSTLFREAGAMEELEKFVDEDNGHTLDTNKVQVKGNSKDFKQNVSQALEHVGEGDVLIVHNMLTMMRESDNPEEILELSRKIKKETSRSNAVSFLYFPVLSASEHGQSAVLRELTSMMDTVVKIRMNYVEDGSSISQTLFVPKLKGREKQHEGVNIEFDGEAVNEDQTETH